MGGLRRVALLCAAVLGLAVSACGDDDKNVVDPIPVGVQGVWALTSVNGLTPPLLLGQNDTLTVELLQSQMRVNADASFSEIFSFRYTTATGIQLLADTLLGTYSVAGATILFQPSDGTGTYQMVLTDNNTLTEDDPGLLLVYKRQ